MSPKAEAILMKYNEPVSTLGLQLREFVYLQLEGCTEIPDSSANIISYGYGKGYVDTVCVIIPSKKGIKLGFYKGSELHDPEKLLTGSGKVHRYVEIKSEKDLGKRALKQLIKEALNAWKSRTKLKVVKRPV